MARKPRLEFEGAFYHVIARGNRREPIFHDDTDYGAYLERLDRYRARDGITLYAYVLMANHVHLLLETGPVPLSRMMQTLQFTYSQYYNQRYGKTGHVFQGRYKAILCDRDAYLLELVRYLHLNPARLRHPLNPWSYPWSSHRAYVGQHSGIRVDTTRVLATFHQQLGPARMAYRRFLKDGLATGHEDKFYETVEQQLLGDERFIHAMAPRMGADPVVSVRLPHMRFGAVLTHVARLYGVSPRDVLAPGRQRKLVPARAMLVYCARAWCRLTTQELGRKLRRDPSMISRLSAIYAAQRDPRNEARVRQAILKQVNTHA